jgi:hypothetical protein
MSFQPRYDEQRGIYRDCKWCGGKGCLSCPAEAEKAYKKAFPDGPKPIATFDTSKLDGDGLSALLNQLIGKPAFEKAEAEAQDRANKIVEENPFVQQLVGKPKEEIKACLAHSLTTEILQENIVKTANPTR